MPQVEWGGRPMPLQVGCQPPEKRDTGDSGGRSLGALKGKTLHDYLDQGL